MKFNPTAIGQPDPSNSRLADSIQLRLPVSAFVEFTQSKENQLLGGLDCRQVLEPGERKDPEAVQISGVEF